MPEQIEGNDSVSIVPSKILVNAEQYHISLLNINMYQ